MWYFKLTGGSKNTIENLSTEIRAKFLSDNKEHLKYITDNIPFLCIGTWKPKDPYKANTRLWITRRYLYKLGHARSDGYTPIDYNLMNGCKYVFIKNADNRETVLPTGTSSIDRIKLTKTLLFLLLQQI
jgi:hypothetical protein